jgi:hypothetical protein
MVELVGLCQYDVSVKSIPEQASLTLDSITLTNFSKLERIRKEFAAWYAIADLLFEIWVINVSY